MIRNRRIIRRRLKVKDCSFCKQKIEPDYKNTDELKKYLTERGKILSRLLSGVCQKHQRHLAFAIKRARYMALLPFIVRPS